MDKTISIAFVIPVIVFLVSCVTGLALYIKNLHKKHDEKEEARFNKSIEMATKFVDAINNSKSSGDTVAKSLDQNTVVLNDLHKYIISKQK